MSQAPARVVIRLVHWADDPLLPDDAPPVRDVWLQSCDVDGRGGRGEVTMTVDRSRAMVFENAGEALDYWRRQSTVQPLRDDGRPNRPLTAFTVEIEKL